MSVDLKEIEKLVVDRFSEDIRNANPKSETWTIDMHVIMAEVAARIVTDYLEEYLKATSSDQDSL